MENFFFSTVKKTKVNNKNSNRKQEKTKAN